MKYIISSILLLATLQCPAQKDDKAGKILDALVEEYEKSTGIEIIFEGTAQTIALKGDKFVSDLGGIRSWFDGKTLWTYVTADEEVTINAPTPEEIRSINPYAILSDYKNGFKYSHAGTQTIRGAVCEKVTLTPEKDMEIREISIAVDRRMRPAYIKIRHESGKAVELTVKEYKTLPLDDSFFRFNPDDYPGIEIYDMR